MFATMYEHEGAYDQPWDPDINFVVSHNNFDSFEVRTGTGGRGGAVHGAGFCFQGLVLWWACSVAGCSSSSSGFRHCVGGGRGRGRGGSGGEGGGGGDLWGVRMLQQQGDLWEAEDRRGLAGGHASVLKASPQLSFMKVTAVHLPPHLPPTCPPHLPCTCAVPLSAGEVQGFRAVPLSAGEIQGFRAVPLSAGEVQGFRAVPLSAGEIQGFRAVPLSAGEVQGFGAVPLSAGEVQGFKVLQHPHLGPHMRVF